MTALSFDRRDVAMLFNLFRMALSDRFLGSGLGLVWAVLSPLMLMGIFVFVFTFVFSSRLPGHEGSLAFVIWLISGYGPWLGVSEGLTSATNSVSSNSGLVKNISFKSELLPMSGALLGLVPLTVALGILFVLRIISGEAPGLTWLLLPIPIILQFVFISGIGLFLGALNVFVRDTALILPNILTLLLFSSPIFYPISVYPQILQEILIFNPFYVIAKCYRDLILESTMPPLWMPLYLALLSALIFIGGLRWFRRLRPFFGARM